MKNGKESHRTTSYRQEIKTQRQRKHPLASAHLLRFFCYSRDVHTFYEGLIALLIITWQFEYASHQIPRQVLKCIKNAGQLCLVCYCTLGIFHCYLVAAYYTTSSLPRKEKITQKKNLQTNSFNSLSLVKPLLGIQCRRNFKLLLFTRLV